MTLFNDDVGCKLSEDCHYEKTAASMGGAGWCIADDGQSVLNRETFNEQKFSHSNLIN